MTRFLPPFLGGRPVVTAGNCVRMTGKPEVRAEQRVAQEG
jgi:hypothetical protein